MSVIVNTVSAQLLLSKIREEISNSISPKWEVDSVGDITLKSPDYHKRAWLHAIQNSNQQLIFALYGRRDETMTKDVYAIYHSRLAEFILRKFDTEIIDITITSMPTNFDSF